MKGDPIENAAYYKSIEAEVEEKLKEKLKDIPECLGYCHMYWATKKELLKKEYGIDWKSPAEMNPHALFD